ncbi:MAG: efflux RND transporter permease subunit [Xanthomonadales bacterium]|nr:efflux RND transporter permease subunit [Gammaproteobacteria bacterium]MBT8053910.1 efflux RND transporter permease subunit [Gammaproteobacteria bacterium]NND58251.1 efflux RND transporter permease subunit [Xanthomonadales bacterium]NNK52038.1 efflux RND transporter permease subunit [Xanthomonadales bacterium]
MIISDQSVRRPVFATVISAMLVILGLASLGSLPVRQYPDIDLPVVSIEISYRGASAEVVETKVTQVVEDAISGIEGIDKLTSTSRDERSDIRVEFNLNRDIDSAANDIRDRVSRVVDQLPEEADPPEIAKVDANRQAVMYLNLLSDRHSGLELTDYADRYLIDRFSTVSGVARVQISGARRYAMRIWLSREALAARGLTVADIESNLRAENVELPAGRLESRSREFTLRTATGFTTADDFRNLVIGRGPDGQSVKLGEVAEVRIGAENERSIARANGVEAVSLAIEQLSKANSVVVSREVQKEMAGIDGELPEGMSLAVNYDRAEFIEASMREVYKALFFAITLVLIVIYLFLGSFTVTLIPALVVPVSVIATFMVMAALGYTINILTLLGLVLAIGLVVDDAIVVLENIYRRIEDGQRPLLAALEGSHEIGFAVIATTLVLVAVFVPLSFIGGDIGRLFREFGITLAAAVLFSSLVALTLTPMLCSKMLRRRSLGSGLTRWVDSLFRRFSEVYRNALKKIVNVPWLAVAALLVLSLLAAWMMKTLPPEYAPKEDRGAFFILLRAPEGASLEYMDRYARQMEAILDDEIGDSESVRRYLTRLPGSWGGAEVNSARSIVLLENWDLREETDKDIAGRLRTRLQELPGVRSFVSSPSSLGLRSDGRPVEMVLGGPDYEQLRDWRDQLLAAIEEMPELVNADSNYQERKPQMNISVDRDRASALGVSLVSVGRTLETMLGSRKVTTYIDRGREYNVILMGKEADRASPDDLTNLYVRSSLTGDLIPLSNLVKITETAGPAQLNRHDRMRSITIEAGLAEGVSLGQGIEALTEKARETLPKSARISWDGESKGYLESGGSLYLTFAMALLVVFLVLAAQFESFINPMIILVTVPLAMTGALAGLHAYGSTVNVFSQIGAILLIGLSAKNGVLIVEFANQLRDRGMDISEAVLEAATVRFRPILMTSAATTFGALPLLLGSGAGWESRQPIGIVIVFGVTISALLTLFIVPALYALFAKTTSSPQRVSRIIEQMQQADKSESKSAPSA